MNAPSPHAIARQRWDAIDLARGAAIVAMVVYHFSWDMSFLKLTAVNVVEEPAWRWFARVIAGSFLTLAGAGLALAHGRGFDRIGFLRRLAKVGGAALAITLVTALVFPESYIFFGILHCIAVTSLLALPFLRAPAALTLIAAAAALAAPWILTDPIFDHPMLDWLGLGSEEPVTNDYVPVLPWFGLVLIGVAIGRALLHRSATMALARWRASGPLSRSLVFAGRRSLVIYLVHQPVLLAVLYGVLQLTGPNPAAEARPFLAQCTSGCIQSNGNADLCRRACACMVDRLRADGTWSNVVADRVTPGERTKVSEAAQVCLRQGAP